MSGTPALQQVWQEVLTEMFAMQTRDNNPLVPRSKQGFLRLAKPVTLIDNMLLVAVPHKATKDVVDNEYGDLITQLVSAKLGRHMSLAVSISPIAEAFEEQAAAPATPEVPAAAVSPATQPAGPEYLDLTDGDEVVLPPPNVPDPGAAQLEAVLLSSEPEPEPQPQAAVSAPAQPVTAEHQLPQSPFSVGGDEPAEAQLPHVSAPAQSYMSTNPLHTGLSTKFTFESFVRAKSNRFPHAAAVAVAERPGQAYNPLYIWGPSGLGKTHLLHAIGNYAAKLQPNLRITYVSSEQFTNDYINSLLGEEKMDSFKRRYRNLDILMVDDIQFLQGKEGTQEEFFHTFNALHAANKQIVLSSDRPPKELTTLEERLRTRFESSLLADVQPPDLETRIAILSSKAQNENIHITRDVLEYIANQSEGSIRELEGALLRVTAYSSLEGCPITVEMAAGLLGGPQQAAIEVDDQRIIAKTAEFFSFTPAMLTGTQKQRQITHARQMAMYLCRELTDASLPQIGEAFGGKDHTTVMYAIRKITKSMNSDQDVYEQLQRLIEIIRNPD